MTDRPALGFIGTGIMALAESIAPPRRSGVGPAKMLEVASSGATGS
jgi:3-hydroxyisobutyrate dehydrogenase-like beta-hydroxyacid dehydrogenase